MAQMHKGHCAGETELDDHVHDLVVDALALFPHFFYCLRVRALPQQTFVLKNLYTVHLFILIHASTFPSPT